MRVPNAKLNTAQRNVSTKQNNTERACNNDKQLLKNSMNHKNIQNKINLIADRQTTAGNKPTKVLYCYIQILMYLTGDDLRLIIKSQ